MPADTVVWAPGASHAPGDPGWTLLTPDGRDPATGTTAIAPLVLPQLLAWVRMGRADRALGELVSGGCGGARRSAAATWPTLDLPGKRALIQNTIADATCTASTGTTSRVDPLAVAQLVRVSDVDAVVAGIDAYLRGQPRATPVAAPAAPDARFGMAAKQRPAGQASPYAQASSYTNGPTLLAMGVAAVAGYAVARYTTKRRR